MMMPKIRSLVRFSGQDRKKCSSKVDGESQSVFLLEERSDEDAAESQGGSARKKKKRAASGAGLPPRGYVTMYVGTEEGDAAETRFVVPATYLSMPAFQPVMEKVTEEFGFEQSGGLCVPCGVEEFLEIMRVTEIASDGAGRLKKMTSRRKTAM